MTLEYESQPLLVLVGAFNPQIMRNAMWIKNYLFPKSSQKDVSVNMNIPLIGGDLSSSMTIDGISIHSELGKVQMTPKEFSTSGYNAIADVVVNLAAALPHTPLLAYGINCCLVESSSKAVLLKNTAIRKIIDTGLSDNTLKIESSCDYKGSKMNFYVKEEKVQESYKISYYFNFHFQMKEKEKSPMTVLKNAIIEGVIGESLDPDREVAEGISSRINPKKKGQQ